MWIIALISSEIVSFFLVYLTFHVDKKDKNITATFFHYLRYNNFGLIYVLILFLFEYFAYYIMSHLYLQTLIFMNLALIAFLAMLLLHPFSNINYNRTPPIENNQENKIQGIIKIFQDAGMVPYIKIMDTDSVKIANAYQSKKHFIYITSYLLSNLTKEEVEGVVAHEMGHSVMRHNLKLVLITWFTLFIGFNGFFYPLVMKRFYFLIIIAFIFMYAMFMGIISLIQRRYEVKADLFACKFVDKDNVISALVKVNKLNKVPDKFSKFSLLANLSHPSTTVRIKKINEWSQKHGEDKFPS